MSFDWTGEGELFISQPNLIDHVARRFRVENCGNVFTPMEANLKLEPNSKNTAPTHLPYQQLLGSLMYIMLGSRPDLCYAISFFGRFQSAATNEHFYYLLRVLKYLYCTRNLRLQFKRNLADLRIFVDADWGNSKDRKSVSGYAAAYSGGLLSWNSRKQTLIALSSTELEYIAASEAVREALFLKNLFSEFRVNINVPVPVFEDNQSDINLVKNFDNNKRIKHVEIKFMFVKDEVEKNNIKLIFIRSADQLADIFTKALGRVLFERHRSKLGLTY